jgi:ABC-type multidrug transport system permease subunit
MICDLPNKILTTIGFDLALYFMTNLRRAPGHFFVFLLFTFTCTLTMSMGFRCIAALSRIFPLVKSSFSLLCFHVNDPGYGTSFCLRSSAHYLHKLLNSYQGLAPWFRWINYLNPVGYAFEALMINEVRTLHMYVSAKSPGSLVPRSHNTMYTICSSWSGLWRRFSK